MYNRKIEAILLEWKETQNHTPLVIKGVRQCGKTSSALAFAKKNYKHVIYIDFHKHNELIEIFNGSLDIDNITFMISANIPNAKFEPHNTCIIFDELQECPRARTSLKYFHLDGRYDIICTGSLLGVSGYKNEKSAPTPVGFEHIVNMYPMDFEEWLWANDIQPDVIDILRDHLNKEKPIPEPLHSKLRKLMLQYIVIGGMPAAVQTFFNTHNINQVASVQRSIISEYKDDMIKYAQTPDKSKIRECFESIPSQLSKENKKFSYSNVRKNGRSKDYIGCLQWIEDAGMIRRCYNLQTPELPLEGNYLRECFKVYMADTGLFVSMLDDGSQADILQGKLYTYKGAIFENALADILGKMNRNLYYFRKTDSLEIDFFIRYNGDCTPLECKATTGNTKSLQTILKNTDKYHISHALKVGDYNIGRKDKILTLPFYMTFLLTNK